MQENEEIVKREIELLQNGRPIILFGAGAEGIVCKRQLEKLGIAVAGFCDNNVILQGKKIENITVFSMEEVKSSYPKALIIKCTCFKPSLVSMTKQLIENGYDSIECSAINYALKKGWKEGYEAGYLIKQCDENISQDDSLFLHLLSVNITEKCTLKCRDCVSLIPYFTSPQHYDADEIIKSIKRLAASVKGIGRLSLLGGETLLHQQLGSIIEAVAEIENIMQIEVITNGTIIPSERDLEIMEKNVSYVTISDYGSLSKRRDELIKILDEHYIIYEVHAQGHEWYSLGKPVKRGRTAKENSNIFQKCRWANNCLSLANGEFRLCSRAHYGSALGVIPKNSLDYVNILDETKTTDEIGEMLKYLINNTQYITACDYCNGSIDAEKVEPAVQLKGVRK